MTIALLAFFVVLNTWLLIVVQRQRVRKRLPWFAFYVAWGLIQACSQLATWMISPRVYIAVYWWMEAIAVILIVGAVRESFLRIFRGFTKIPWFRWTVSGVIGAVAAYSAWKAIYHPPVQGNWLSAFVIDAEFLFRWGIAAIGLLTMVLTWLLYEPANSREDAVITGFTLTSGTFVAAIVIVSFFGTTHLFVSKYLPAVGYFLAVLLWIRVFSRSVEGFGFAELGIGPEDLLKLIRRYREDVKHVRGKP